MLKNGAPGVCTAKSDQKPPSREKGPPVRAGGLASGCPRVALTANLPPALVPPPPPITKPSIEYVCAWPPVASISNPIKSTVPENMVANERNVFRHGFGTAGMGDGDIKRGCFVFIVRPWGSSYATSTRHSLFCPEILHRKYKKMPNRGSRIGFSDTDEAPVRKRKAESDEVSAKSLGGLFANTISFDFKD